MGLAFHHVPYGPSPGFCDEAGCRNDAAWMISGVDRMPVPRFCDRHARSLLASMREELVPDPTTIVREGEPE